MEKNPEGNDTDFADKAVFFYTLHLADNALIFAQRNSEWCAHGPVLEQDIAISNISLDLLGQARNFYQYAASLYNEFSKQEKENVDMFIPSAWKSFNRELNEDDLAFLRNEDQYLSLLITELPKGDWALTVLRQFFFSAFQYYQFSQLQNCSDVQLAGVAAKSLKEVTYHLRWSSEWVVRLGDGTAESKRRVETASNELWSFTNELFDQVAFEQTIEAHEPVINLNEIKQQWQLRVKDIFTEATISVPMPSEQHSPGNGKEGRHTHHLQGLLNEMQVLQRSHPNLTW